MKNTDTSSTESTHLNSESDSPDTRRSGTIRLTSLQELKAVFLSMDWEINDEILNKLIVESEKLISSAGDDLVLVAHFKMMASIGRYIKKNKAGADKDAVGLLGSIFESTEKVISTEELSEKERKQLVVDQIAKFQVLKQKITGIQVTPTIKKRMEKGALDEVIKTVQAEVASLREEVAELRGQLKQLLAH